MGNKTMKKEDASKKLKFSFPSLAHLESTVKLPEPRVFQLPTELDRLYEGLEDIGIGPRYFRHIRKGQYHLELGGAKTGYCSYLFIDIVDDPEDIVDGKVSLYGPDINEIEPGSTFPYGMHIKMYGKGLARELMEYLERTTFLAG